MSLTRSRRQQLSICRSHLVPALWLEMLSRAGIRQAAIASIVAGIGLTIPGLCLPAAVAQEPPIQKLAQIPARGRAMGEMSLLFVNPTLGDDSVGNGSERVPFKTISQALRAAQPNTVILLAAGTYSEQTGETFPLQLKPGVTVQGDPRNKGQNILIKGGGPFISPTFARQDVAILGASQAGLTGVTVTNPNPRGYGLWVESSSPIVLENTFTGNTHDGISVTGDSAPAIRENYFFQNGANGITVYGTSRPEIRENVFEKTGFGINLAQNAAPLIIGNRLTQNKDAIVSQAYAQPVLRSNMIEGNERDGVVAIAQARPDLGTATEQGGNVFRNNGRFDINSKASNQVIPAFGNELASDRTSGQIDLAGTVSQIASTPVVPTTDQPVSPQLAPSPQPEATVAIAEPPQEKIASAPAQNPQPQPLPLPVLNATASQVAAPPAKPSQSASLPSAAIPTPLKTSPQVELSQPVPRQTASATSAISAASFPVPARLSRSAAPTGPSTAPMRIVAGKRSPATPAVSVPNLPKTTPVNSPVAKAAPIAIPVAPPRAMAPKLQAPVSRGGSKARLPVQAPIVSAPAVPLQTVAPTVTPKPTAIEIPVPPPVSTTPRLQPAVTKAASNPRLSVPSVSRPTASVPVASTAATPIEIPVPPPESGSATQSPALTAVAPSTAQGQSAPPAGVLPVPTADIPLGSTGDLPTVTVPQTSTRLPGAAPPPPNRMTTLELRYRVVVPVDDETAQVQVRSLVPDAFRTVYNGRVMMQVGAYSDRIKAEEMQQMITSKGLQATIEQAN